MKICSACLLGVNCRYDGKNNLNRKVLSLACKEILIPVCPEQLGGLPTPREPSEIVGNKVITKSGKDLTKNFRKGAREVLRIANLFNIKEAMLKQNSPSCGYGQIYNGTFCKKIIKGNGITASLLERNKIKIITEDDI